MEIGKRVVVDGRARSLGKPIPSLEIGEAMRSVDNEPQSRLVAHLANRPVRVIQRSLTNKEGGARLCRQAWMHALR